MSETYPPLSDVPAFVWCPTCGAPALKRPTDYRPDRIVALTDTEIDALREQMTAAPLKEVRRV